MNKSDLVDAIATATNEGKSKVAGLLEAVLDHISGALQKGDKVTLPGFGTFETRRRQARYERQQAMLAKEIKFIEKFKARASHAASRLLNPAAPPRMHPSLWRKLWTPKASSRGTQSELPRGSPKH